MSEALLDDHSPLADYLRQTHDSMDHPSSSSQHRPSPSSSSVAPPPPQAPSPAAPRPPSRLRNRASQAATERLKYALATSALLSAKLADALQLYPPLEALEASNLSAGRDAKGKQRAEDAAEGSEGGVSWPADWENVGQGWQDRGVVGNAEVALGGLVSALKRLSRASTAAPVAATGRRAQAGNGRPGPEEKAVERVEEFIAAAQELDLRVAAALGAIKELECIAHGLGLSDPLPPISRIEARSYTAYLSSSTLRTAASTSQASPSTPARVPSPLIPSPPRFDSESASSSSPPPLRALPLRRALASALSAALTALSTASTSLESLLPTSSALRPSPSPPRASASSHAPRASLSELLRHSHLAALERAEVSSFNDGGSASSVSHSRPASVVFPSSSEGPVDPFHPTESTFGGIERRHPQHYHTLSSSSSSYLAAPELSRQPSLPTLLGGGSSSGGKHRLRPSLGAVGAFGLGTAAFSTPVKGAGAGRKKRPASLGGWGGQTTVFKLKSDAGSAPSSPSLSAKEVEEEPEEDAEEGALQLDAPAEAEQREDLAPFLLVSLQQAFEDAHDARRAVLWRLLEALENPDVEVGEETLWKKVEAVFAALADGLTPCAAGVKEANELEFGGGAATPAAGRALSSGEEQRGRQEQQTIKAREREKKRRSGLFYGGIDGHFVPPSPASHSAPPLTPVAQHRAAGVQHALARLTGAAASPLPASPTPARHLANPAHAPPPASYANFAPSSRSIPSTTPRAAASASAATVEAQHHLTALTLPLRAIQAKLRLISADFPAASSSSSTPSPEVDRLLSTYDSILPELERLTSSFHAGRSALRVALGIDAPGPPSGRPLSIASSSADGHAHGVEPLLEEDETPPPEQDEPDRGAVYASLDDGAEAGAAVEADERQALLDAALSMALFPPTPEGVAGTGASEEKVFEAVAGPEKARAAGGEKLSREERIRRMKEAREALALGRSAVTVAPDEEGAGGGGGGGVQQQQKMVGELREVLKELNRERGRPEEAPRRAEE
ncbi:hypothetical protein JCM6882_006020 [Rhodosporidiobolus microsporus]